MKLLVSRITSPPVSSARTRIPALASSELAERRRQAAGAHAIDRDVVARRRAEHVALREHNGLGRHEKRGRIEPAR